MVLHLDTAKEPSLRNLFQFRRERTKLRGFVVSSAGLVQNPEAWFVLYETFSGFVRNWKRFRSEGSFAVSRWRTILGFVEFFIAFFDVSTHLEGF